MRNRRVHPQPVWIVTCCVGLGLCPSAPAAIQYDVTVLDKAGGQAFGVYNGKVAGVSASESGAAVWLTPSQPVALRAPGFGSNTTALAIWGNQEGGYGRSFNGDMLYHALLWNGTSAGAVDLGTNAIVYGIYNGVQVGTGPSAACYWTGTAQSVFSINPPSTAFDSTTALAIWGTQAVGLGQRNDNPHAIFWSSLSPSGAVDLNTSAFSKSEALGVSRGQAVGWASVITAGTLHAAIWSSPAPSRFKDLAPAGTTASELYATNGTQQVGDVSFTQGGIALPVDHHAAVWSGTAASYQVLPMPQGFNYSIATGIDGKGDISGWVADEVAGGTSADTPVRWSPTNLVPGDANFDGSVGFDDLIILAKDYGKPGGWVDGDFSGDGIVNFSDLVVLAQNYGKTSPMALVYTPPSTSVPEPSGAALLVLLGGLLARHRRVT